jgi:uroporphyrinogen decarboxylase
MTTKAERLQAAIAGELADRPPVALWRHFPVDDQDPVLLAQATIAFQRIYDFDFIKVTPASSFCINDYGVRDEWQGNPEGTRQYVQHAVNSIDDWSKIGILDPRSGKFGKQLECLTHLQEKIGNETPYIQTIFNPLSQGKNLAGSNRMLVHMRQNPKIVLEAFDRITETTIAFIEHARECGIAGIFYAIQFGTFEYFTPEDYAQFGEPFDRKILEAADGLWLNVLHLHGEDLIFELAEKYPVHIVNWHDRETKPTLKEGKSRLSAAVCGGLRRWETMVLGDSRAVQEEAMDAIQSLDGGRGMVLGTGCVVPVLAPHGNLLAARQIVDSLN